jgi:hypothetical protein
MKIRPTILGSLQLMSGNAVQREHVTNKPNGLVSHSSLMLRLMKCLQYINHYFHAVKINLAATFSRWIVIAKM